MSARVKTSLAPGSRVVSDYLQQSGLLPYLEKLGFHQVGYGCTTCIGNSGPLDADYEKALIENDLIGVSVLSGNRNFEARVHQNIRANFLMSPPLVVAFALAGRITVDMEKEPIGQDANHNAVYLREIWPSSDEIAAVMKYATTPKTIVTDTAKILTTKCRCGRKSTAATASILTGEAIPLTSKSRRFSPTAMARTGP